MTRTGDWISQAWEKVTKGQNFWMFVLLMLIYGAIAVPVIIIMSVVQRIYVPPMPTEAPKTLQEFLTTLSPFIYRSAAFNLTIGNLITSAVFGPVTGAVYAIIFSFLRVGRVDLRRLEGVFPVAGQTILGMLVTSFFVNLAMWFCLIPSIILAISYKFTIPLIVERKLGFWQAMEESRKKVWRSFWGFLGFFLVLGLIHILGVLVCCVGVFVAVPITWVATAIAYKELWPEPTEVVGPAQT